MIMWYITLSLLYNTLLPFSSLSSSAMARDNQFPVLRLYWIQFCVQHHLSVSFCNTENLVLSKRKSNEGEIGWVLNSQWAIGTVGCWRKAVSVAGRQILFSCSCLEELWSLYPFRCLADGWVIVISHSILKGTFFSPVFGF